jgi:hypothetical protein
MARSAAKSFECPVVSETVSISLRRRPTLRSPQPLYVHCGERECQHVDTNAPPCPLTLELFAAEIAERLARRAG